MKFVHREDLAVWQNPRQSYSLYVQADSLKTPAHRSAIGQNQTRYTKLENCSISLPEEEGSEIKDVSSGKLARWLERLNAILFIHGSKVEVRKRSARMHLSTTQRNGTRVYMKRSNEKVKLEGCYVTSEEMGC